MKEELGKWEQKFLKLSDANCVPREITRLDSTERQIESLKKLREEQIGAARRHLLNDWTDEEITVAGF